MHKHILITGLPATGKTTLSEFFKGKGKNAYDADKIIGRFVDRKTGKPREPTRREWKAWSSIDWEWNETKLKKLLKENRELYLFGMANNVWEFFNLFDRVYYLYADRKLILQRLKDRTRTHDFGGYVTQRKALLSWVKPIAKRAKKESLIFIDASLSPKQIFDIIVG